MTSVAIVGGGRWARVIASVLAELPGEPVAVSLHTRRGYDATRAWRDSRPGRDIRVAHDWPERRPDALIVANAARDHAAATARAIEEGVPVLVEKPFVLGGRRATALVETAHQRGVLLATAHVFSFASYLDALKREIQASGELRSLRLRWSDPSAELRYGERKTHDGTLTIVEDVLPHVVSIVLAISGSLADRCDLVELNDEGDRATLVLHADETRCEVSLERNAARRARVVEADLSSCRARLDFTEEPGTLTVGPRSEPAATAWGRSPGPLARMLGAFLFAADGGPMDPRLDPLVGVRAVQLTDSALGR